MAALRPYRLVRYNCIHFNFDEPFGINKAIYRHDRVDRTRVEAVELSGVYGLLPILDVCKDYSCSYDVLQPGTSSFQCFLDYLKALSSLLKSIANTNRPAFTIDRCGSTDSYEVADPDRTGEADNTFHWIAIRNQFPSVRHN